MVVLVRLEALEGPKVGLHPSEVPELDVVVVPARDYPCAWRVYRQCRHCLTSSNASAYATGSEVTECRAHLRVVLHDDLVAYGPVLVVVCEIRLPIVLIFVILLLFPGILTSIGAPARPARTWLLLLGIVNAQ